MEKIAKRIIEEHNARTVELVFAGYDWHAKAMPQWALVRMQAPERLKERGQTSITVDEINALLDELGSKPLATASHKRAEEAVKLLLEKLGG